MTYKEWMAVVQLLGAVMVGIWLVLDAGASATLDIAALAAKLLWAIVAVIVFNIVATILSVIVGSILQGEEIKDEATDERDRQVADRSMRNSGMVQSLGAVGGLLILATSHTSCESCPSTPDGHERTSSWPPHAFDSYQKPWVTALPYIKLPTPG